MPRLLFFSWIFGAVFLFLYSFTQVDLSLTLTQLSFWQVIQGAFQQIGYFQRPLSLTIYLVVFGLLFALYLFTLNLVKKRKITRKQLFAIIIAISVILFLSYSAFSYDLFNYIFDAKVFTFYFQNPYFHKALDFPEDPMLSFMHWTHRAYPYGPVWLGITIPLSFIGQNIFLLTFYLFKLLSFAAFIFSAFLIERIANKIGINALFAVAVFSLNPLVLSESLVSSHNDIIMAAFALFSLLLFFEGKLAKSFFWFTVSVGVKFATVFMIPAFFLKRILKLNNEKLFLVLSISMLVPIILASIRTNFQPWYLLFVLPFTVFISEKRYILIPTIIVTLASILYYIPFIYLGNWDPPILTYLNLLITTSIIVSIVLAIVAKYIKK